MRAPWRAMGWAVVGTVAAVGLAYGVLLLINLRDEPRSAQATALLEAHARRPAVADEDNGFVYLLGMTAPDDASVREVGRERLRRMAAGQDAYANGPPGRQEYTAARSLALRGFAAACGGDPVACAGALRQAQATPLARQWLADEAWLLVRYRALITHRGWRESLPHDLQLPRYQEAVNGQQLLLMQAWLAARQGDHATVDALLSQDMRFWRLVLRDADTLISKMIATAAVERNFAMGSLVLRELGPAQSPPAPWRAPLNAQERSMTRALAGELRFLQLALARLDDEARVRPIGQKQAPLERVLDRLGRPLLRPQATLNLAAARLAALAQASTQPYDGLVAAVARADVMAPVRPWQWLFNPTGRVMAQMGDGAYRGYVLRVSDLEGVRRAAVEAVRLRAEGVAADAVATRLAAPDAARDPYTGAPLAWDDGAIRFDGHDPRARSQRLIY